MSIEIKEDKCTGCGRCVEVCPVDAITLDDGKAIINDEECVECGACESECPNNAIQIV